MRAAGWAVALAILVGAATHPLTAGYRAARLQPRAQSDRPATDLPEAAGYRAVWATGEAIERHVRNGDHALDVVSRVPDPAPYFDLRRSTATTLPDVRLAKAVSRMDLVAIVTVTALEIGPWRQAGRRTLPPSTPPALETRRIAASVDQVIKNTSRFRIAPGQSVTFSYEGGGTTVVGDTVVTTRLENERVPERGHRYLWFFAGTETELFGGTAANAIDISGVRLLPVSRADDSRNFSTLSVDTGLAIVRRAATFPAQFREPPETFVESPTRRRVARRRAPDGRPGVIVDFVR